MNVAGTRVVHALGRPTGWVGYRFLGGLVQWWVGKISLKIPKLV